jgi:hypothetical protein
MAASEDLWAPSSAEPFQLPDERDYVPKAGRVQIRQLHRTDAGDVTHALESVGDISEVR